VGTAGGSWLTGSSTADGLIRSEANLIFGIGNSEKTRIDSSGRLLVGTSSSAGLGANLQVRQNNGYAIEAFRSSNDANGSFIWVTKSRGTEGSPTEVLSGDSLGGYGFRGYDGAGYVDAAYIYAEADADWTTSGDTTDNPSRLVFSTTADGASSPTERMRIDSLGRFYLGTTNTDPTFNRVNGIYINQNSQLLCRQAGSGGWDLGSGSSTPTHIYFYTDNGSARVTAGNISSNGATTTYNQTSDYRLKENVVALTGASERLSLLRPVNFDWKEGFGGTQPKGEGFIAHELQEVCPLAVQGEKDAVDDKGNPKYQGIDQAKLVPLLTAALQEAIGRIETLEAEVAALKAS
jgi:hypothetical protein